MFSFIFFASSVPPVIEQAQMGVLKVFPKKLFGVNAVGCSDNSGS
jgi:hypothetical protein